MWSDRRMGRGGRGLRAAGTEGILFGHTDRVVPDPGFPALAEENRVVSYGELAERIDGGGGADRRLVLDGPADSRWAIALLSGLAGGAEVVLPDPDWTEAVRRETLAALAPPTGLAGVRLFTSGTTGRPRSCFRSVDRLATMVGRVRARLPRGLGSGRPTVLSLAPLEHGYGLMNGLLLPLAIGGTAVLPPHADPARALVEREVRMLYAWPGLLRDLARTSHGLARFSPDLAAQDLRRTRCADPQGSPCAPDGALSDDASTRTLRPGCECRSSAATPAHVPCSACRCARLHEKSGRARGGVPRLPALRWCVSSSFGLDPETAAAFAARTGCPVRQQYGTTELGPLCVDDEEPPRPQPGCVGRPLPGVEVEARDGDGRRLAPGGRGELFVRVEPARDWWPTGDRGACDAEGRVFVLGRLKPFTDERKDL